MAATIKMNHDELVTIAKKYVDASDNIDSTLASLRTAQSELASIWEGDAYAAFEEQFNALAPKVEDFSRLMTDINMQLNQIAVAVSDTDSEIGNIVKRNTGQF